MDNVRGPGGANHVPNDPALPSDSSQGAVPSGFEPRPPSNNAAFDDAPRAGEPGSRRATFSAPGGPSAEAVSEGLRQRATQIRSLTDLRQTLGAINALPPALQVIPLAAMSQRIEHIHPAEDRYVALMGVRRATGAISSAADCSPIISQLPFAAASLAEQHLESGYQIVRGAISQAQRSGIDEESNRYALHGLALLLTQVPNSDSRVTHAKEADRLLTWLEALPPQYRISTHEVLSRKRFELLSPAAAEIITFRTLHALEHDDYTPEQRTQIAMALVGGLAGMRHPDARFDSEFVRLFQASKTQENPQTRLSMLSELSGYSFFDRLSPEIGQSMRTAVHGDMQALIGTHPEHAFAQFMQQIEQVFAALGEHPDPDIPKSEIPHDRAQMLAAVAATIGELPDGPPMQNPRVEVYMRLGNVLIQEMLDTKDPALRQQLLEINTAMIAARGHLHPEEQEAIDQMLSNGDVARALVNAGYDLPDG